MSGMHTTCPSCNAVFRITTEQLDARAGKVRCGKCAFVFNAFDTLVTPIETVSLMAAPPEPGFPDINFEEEHITLQPAPATVAEPLTGSFPIPSDDQIDRETEEINRSIAETERLETRRESRKRPETEELKAPEEVPPPASESDEEAPAPAAKSKLEITPDLQEKLKSLQDELSNDQKRARWSAFAWGTGVLLLVLLLAAQLAYFKRDWLAAHYPQSQPALESLCDVLQCKVELLADVERIKLESSDLQTDPDQANTVVLTALLRNQAPYRQAYPHLELTLTDSANQPLARRHFTPRDYLAKDVPADPGMPSNEEVAVKLSLELVDVNAVGYKLFIYYP